MVMYSQQSGKDRVKKFVIRFTSTHSPHEGGVLESM
jgi:hypothetical protein